MYQNKSNAYQNAVNNLQNMFNSLKKCLREIKDSFLMLEDDEAYLSLWLHKSGPQNLLKSLYFIEENNLTSKIKIEETQNELTKDRSLKIQYDPKPHNNSNLNLSSNAMQQMMKQNFSFENDSDSNSDQQSDSDDKTQKIYKRGPYKNYTVQQKQKAVEMYLIQQRSVIDVSRTLRIPCKNIKRWSQYGVLRKKGGGRKKFNPQTQKAVASRVKKTYFAGTQVAYEQIQKIAKTMCTDENFKASRGWVVKFVERQNLKDIYTFV